MGVDSWISALGVTNACSKPITRKADAGGVPGLVISTRLIVLVASSSQEATWMKKERHPYSQTTKP